MLVSYDQFLVRLRHVTGQVAAACAEANRDPASVSILPVTKSHPADAVAYAARAGLRAVGENRVQEAAQKHELLAELSLKWELIGHLQSNKAKLAASLFDRIQSVDRIKLIRILDRAAGEAGRRLAVLVQVNAGNDPAKFGCEPGEAPVLVETILASEHLKLDGLMTIAPLSDDPAVATRTFNNLRTCRDDLQEKFGIALPELSMGMTGDLREAVMAGSTQVRIGTALFGERESH